MGEDKTLAIHQRAGVLRITLNRPEKRNALNPEMMDELTQVLLGEAD